MAEALATPEVNIDQIDVVEEFNARKKMGKEELKELSETIEETGLVAPIKVRKKDDGRFDLVAGHRRLEAAKMAGLTKIEVTLSTGNPQTEALVENIHRVDLNPIETALGLQALAEEHHLDTNKKIAQKARKREDWVGAHLRLLKLPKIVQKYIAAGHVPMDAEPQLRPIAKVSPRVAAYICEVGKQEELSGRQFIDRFGDLFEQAPRIEGMKNVPTMICVPRFNLSEVVDGFDAEGNKEHEKLMQRAIAAFYNYEPYRPTDAQVQLGEPEIDAARAAGVLVEHIEDHFTRAFIIDRELAADLLERAIERRTKERAEEADQAELRKQELKEERKRAREQRKANGELSPQAQAKADAQYAVRCNDALGGKLLKRRSGGKDKKHALARAKLVATLFVDQNPDLAGRGLRFTIDKLRNVERTPLKKGGFKEKVTYATDDECTAELRRRIEGARSETEVNEVLTEAILAAILADSKAEPASRRPRWSESYDATKQTEKILKAELKEIRPRKPRRVQQKTASK